jgi:hypothetical protein
MPSVHHNISGDSFLGSTIVVIVVSLTTLARSYSSIPPMDNQGFHLGVDHKYMVQYLQRKKTKTLAIANE